MMHEYAYPAVQGQNADATTLPELDLPMHCKMGFVLGLSVRVVHVVLILQPRKYSHKPQPTQTLKTHGLAAIMSQRDVKSCNNA
eukprot:1367672-Amphidinium_carterae.1